MDATCSETPLFETPCVDTVVAAKNLTLTIGGKKRLQNISLTVTRGRCLALMGKSGAGKTTLAKTLAGVAEGQLTGILTFRNTLITELPSKQLRSKLGHSIAIVPQTLADILNPQMTILAHIKESLKTHQKLHQTPVKTTATEALIEGNVPAHLHHCYPSQLSGGETQRVLLVLAFLHQPDLIILDEPTASLDSKTTASVVQYIRRKAENSAVVLTSHDTDIIKSVAHDVAVIHKGQVIEHQPVDKLFNKSESTITQQIIQTPVAVHHKITQPINHNDIVLSLKNASYRHNKNTLIENLSFDIKQHETLIIEGRSGIGKSTLAQILAGWIPLQSGELEFPIAQQSLSKKTPVALIPQHPYTACASHMPIWKIVSEPLELLSVKKTHSLMDSAISLLTAVNLPVTENFLFRRPSMLSGGELQRVIIARALAIAPQILIADEPTSALDTIEKKSILALFETLQKQHGFSLIIFTHDPHISQFLGITPMTLSHSTLSPVISSFN